MSLLRGRRALVIYTGRRDGLGNRVRALLSAQALAEAEDRDLYYVWSTGRHFGPRMDDLWVFDAGRRVPRLAVRALSPVAPLRPPDGTVLGPRLRRERLWQIRSRGLPVTWTDPAWQASPEPADLSGRPGRAPGEVGPRVPRRWDQCLRDLTPVEAVAARVHAFYDTYLRGRPYVGVQVRSHRVSHARTLQSSPVEWFVRRMREIRAQYPEVRFFLSCDTEQAQARVMEEVGGCVALSGKGAYNTTQGVRSALVDLYLLASAQHLIGAAHSSFVEMAVFLCDGIVPFERPGQPADGGVDLGLPGTADPLRPAGREDSLPAGGEKR